MPSASSQSLTAVAAISAARAEQVVPAAVARAVRLDRPASATPGSWLSAGQRVVFAEDRDDGPAFAPFSHHGGRDARRALGHPEALGGAASRHGGDGDSARYRRSRASSKTRSARAVNSSRFASARSQTGSAFLMRYPFVGRRNGQPSRPPAASTGCSWSKAARPGRSARLRPCVTNRDGLRKSRRRRGAIPAGGLPSPDITSRRRNQETR